MTLKILTDNPFVDELVYRTKQLAMGCIIKNESIALKDETVETMRDAALYISAIEGRSSIELFIYTREILTGAGSPIPVSLVENLLINIRSIPDQYREPLRQYMMAYTIANYEEKNEYYRMLNGKPPMGIEGIKLSSEDVPEDFESDIVGKYLHEIDRNALESLDAYGALDVIIAKNPDVKYLKYLILNITIYSARISENFQILYSPIITSVEISNKFKSKYELNRVFTLKTVYSEAFKYESDYYDNFIIIFIVIQTMIDIVSEVQEHIARKDVFDERCIKFIFESYGIPYYNEIPIKFQLAMMKNIHSLLKYKSTAKCMVNICSIFGFPDVQIFKYFLLKDRKTQLSSSDLALYVDKHILESEPVVTESSTIIIPNNTRSITLTFPVKNYFAKNNIMIVKIGTLIVPQSSYIISGNTLTFNESVSLKGISCVDVDYVYTNTNRVITNTAIPVNTLAADDSLYIPIPFPFDDYLEDGNYFFVSVGVDKLLSRSEYDNINGHLVIYNAASLTSPVIVFYFLYDSLPLTTIAVEDYNHNYNLKFIKVGLNENEDKTIRKKEKYINYDAIVLEDDLWDGEDSTHQQIKSDILEKEFAYLRTKYISIDVIYDATELSFTISYFFNMLFDDLKLEENLTIAVPMLSDVENFRLNDIFCYLFSLAYEFNGIRDDIMDTTSKILHIKGFNFHADLATLKDYLETKMMTDEGMYDYISMINLGVEGFEIPKAPIMTYKALMDLYTNNKNIYDHIVHEMNNARDKKIYELYKKIFDSLMNLKFNLDFYKKPDGTLYPTFTKYLQSRNGVLFRSLIKIRAISDPVERQKEIVDIISNVVYALEEYIDSDRFKYLYHGLPGVSAEYAVQYISKIINFFKSYKIYLYGVNVVYTMGDKAENTIRPICKLGLTSIFDKKDQIMALDTISIQTDMTKKDASNVLEKIYITYF